MKKTIKLGGVTVPEDLKGKELLKFMKDNIATLIAEKKAELRKCDAIPLYCDMSLKYCINKEGKLEKASADALPDLTEMKEVLCAINTTNWMDSHSDVHIPGIWKKSIKDNKYFSHLQEHQRMFTHIISDESKAYTQLMTWKELGYDLPGMTEVLVFRTPLTGRNPYMEEQYRKGYVKNHSVAMIYVILKFCVNEPDDEYFKEEYANWVQYSPMVINLEKAEEQGYFWAILEAKIVEGSAVPIGSNIMTPTIGFKSLQPPPSTEENQPTTVTEEKEEEPVVVETVIKSEIDWDKIANHLIN